MSTVTVHALSTGSLTIFEHFFIFPADPIGKRSVPSLSFLIQHQTAGKTTRLVFDLGIRRDTKLYPEALQKHCASRAPLTTRPDVVESLAKGGLGVDDIDFIVLSHVHYDHVGLPSDFTNPNTTFIVGRGALDLLSGKSKLNIGSHSVFEPDLLPTDRTIELPSTDSSQPEAAHRTLNLTWQQLVPFHNAIDIFSDGSVRIIDAPGHLPGHINLLCRLSRDKYVLLAGDACHDVRLLTGERDIPTWLDAEGNRCCIHADPAATKETLQRIRKVEKEGLVVDGNTAEVEVVFAHNWEWERDAVARDRFWPGRL